MADAIRHVIWAILIVSLSGCGGSSGIDPLPEDSNEPGWHEGNLSHDGLDRVFRFYVPERLPDSAPVVVLLHGGTQSMDAIEGARTAAVRRADPGAAESRRGAG